MLSSLVRCSDADRSRELEGGFLSDCDSATEASPSELLDRGGVAGVWASTGASSSSTPAAPAVPATREPRSQSWLLRLGAPCTPTRRRRSRAHHRFSRTDRARHAILAWRLKRPYLIYCAACSAVTALLLVWNLAKGFAGPPTHQVPPQFRLTGFHQRARRPSQCQHTRLCHVEHGPFGSVAIFAFCRHPERLESAAVEASPLGGGHRSHNRCADRFGDAADDASARLPGVF
mmetsp:Transcript_783/g.2982  ORF Transcript_783/g.2982 Transcript_783/m.2982 type:complete len:232 (+) Transcript_783:159-854(+)